MLVRGRDPGADAGPVGQRHRVGGASPETGVEGGDLLRYADAERGGVVGVDPEWGPEPRCDLLLALAQPGPGGGGAQLFG